MTHTTAHIGPPAVARPSTAPCFAALLVGALALGAAAPPVCAQRVTPDDPGSKPPSAGTPIVGYGLELRPFSGALMTARNDVPLTAGLTYRFWSRPHATEHA